MTSLIINGMAGAWHPAIAAGPESAINEAPTRDQIAEEYKWNLRDIFETHDDFVAAFDKTGKLFEDFAELCGSLSKSPEALLKALKLEDKAGAALERVTLYAGLSFHQDMSDDEAQGRWDCVQMLGTRASEANSWFVPEILSIPEEKINEWLSANDKLAVYRHAIADLLREKQHVLSPREEELLAMAGEVTAAPSNIYGRFTNTNLDFPIIKDEDGNDLQLSSAAYSELLYSPDRRVRRDAFLGMHETYDAKKNTLSALLSAQVKQHIFYARARHYESSLQCALNGPNVPVEVYRNLVDTVNKNLHRLHRYVALKKKMLGLDAIHRYDLYVQMARGTPKKIEYDDAVKTILAALKPLGGDYLKTLKKAFQSRWIDVYETRDKRSGTYSWGAYNTHPYLLLNYKGTMNNQSTVAHEIGHAMHSWYTTHNQPYVYGGYATFCAEVASTVNEVLLAHHLLDQAATDVERMLILEQQIEGIRTTVFRQTMFAEFELKIHEEAEAGKSLTGNSLRRMYGDLVMKYYGSLMVMDPPASAECLRIPHFYRNFYVFTYATSHCAATNIGRRIIDGRPAATEGLMKFLSAGCSAYPLDVLKLAGVDMTSPRPIEDTMGLFSELMDQFEALNGSDAAAAK